MVSRHPWTNRIGGLALGLGLAMSFVIGPCWWTIFRYHNPICSQYKPDFVSLYTGAVLISSDGAALYDLERQRKVQEPIDPGRGDWVLPFYYPPFFALFLAPLARLSFSAAFALVTLINVGLLVVALRALMRELDLNLSQRRWLVLATFCNYGVHYALLEAQTSFLALTLLVLYVSALLRNHDRQAGSCSGLLFFKPPLLLVPLLVLLIKRFWRGLAVAAMVIGTLCLVSYAAVGLEGVRGYFALSQRAMAGDDFLHIQPERMHNLRALVHYFIAGAWREYVWYGLTLIVIGLTARDGYRIHERELVSPSIWIRILISLILVAPHLHDHDLTLLILPAAFLLKLGSEDVPPWVALTLVVAGFLPLLNTMAYPLLPPLVPLAGLVFLLAETSRRFRQLLTPVTAR
jgi:hypothetical protein